MPIIFTLITPMPCNDTCFITCDSPMLNLSSPIGRSPLFFTKFPNPVDLIRKEEIFSVNLPNAETQAAKRLSHSTWLLLSNQKALSLAKSKSTLKIFLYDHDQDYCHKVFVLVFTNQWSQLRFWNWTGYVTTFYVKWKNKWMEQCNSLVWNNG